MKNLGINIIAFFVYLTFISPHVENYARSFNYNYRYVMEQGINALFLAGIVFAVNMILNKEEE